MLKIYTHKILKITSFFAFLAVTFVILFSHNKSSILVSSTNILSDDSGSVKKQDINIVGTYVDGVHLTQGSSIEYINADFGFSLHLPSSWAGYIVDVLVGEYTQYHIVTILPPKGVLLPNQKIYSFVVWPVSEKVPSLAVPGVIVTEFARNSSFAFGTLVDGASSYVDARDITGATHGFKVFDPPSKEIVVFEDIYPKNLAISGFQIVDGVAEITTSSQCLKGIDCGDEPSVAPLTLQASYVSPDGVIIGVYSYRQKNEVAAFRYFGIPVGYNYSFSYIMPSVYVRDMYYKIQESIPDEVIKSVILTGKDGAWQYADLKCVHNQLNCLFNRMNLDGDDVYLWADTGMGPVDIAYIDLKNIPTFSQRNLVLSSVSGDDALNHAVSAKEQVLRKWVSHLESIRRLVQENISHSTKKVTTPADEHTLRNSLYFSFSDVTNDSIPELLVQVEGGAGNFAIYRLIEDGDHFESITETPYTLGGDLYRSWYRYITTTGTICTVTYDYSPDPVGGIVEQMMWSEEGNSWIKKTGGVSVQEMMWDAVSQTLIKVDISSECATVFRY